jgi:putative membrane protein
MIRLLISAAIHLAANALGLLVADVVLDDMSVDASSFIMAVLIFTGVEVLAEPLFRQMAIRNVQALAGSVALISTFVGLVVTNIVSDGLSITGLGTWIAATVIVWLAALLAALLLPVFFVKKAVDNN